jgi:hypothetical protein
MFQKQVGEPRPYASPTAHQKDAAPMLGSWRLIDDDTPRDRPLRLRGSKPKPFECVGHFVGAGWAGVADGRTTGAIFPEEWKPLNSAPDVVGK